MTHTNASKWKELLPQSPDVQEERKERSDAISRWFEPPTGWQLLFWLCKPIAIAGLVVVLGLWLFKLQALRLTIGLIIGFTALVLGFISWLQVKRSSWIWVAVRWFLIGIGIAFTVPHVSSLIR